MFCKICNKSMLTCPSLHRIPFYLYSFRDCDCGYYTGELLEPSGIVPACDLPTITNYGGAVCPLCGSSPLVEKGIFQEKVKMECESCRVTLEISFSRSGFMDSDSISLEDLIYKGSSLESLQWVLYQSLMGEGDLVRSLFKSGLEGLLRVERGF